MFVIILIAAILIGIGGVPHIFEMEAFHWLNRGGPSRLVFSNLAPCILHNQETNTTNT